MGILKKKKFREEVKRINKAHGEMREFLNLLMDCYGLTEEEINNCEVIKHHFDNLDLMFSQMAK
ncbi:hypothetical protein [Bacillus cereus]|uniref:hypothetical protein n=1 Tax=Bacillus cereus TaxID=1396 RepID=UPI000BF3FF71|nr:hypothetical protein [Bacillus cereus]PFU22049.1 hypothetical protein COK76_24305 [Bacillus cereus]